MSAAGRVDTAHAKLSSQQCLPEASISAPTDGIVAFVPSGQGCLDLQNEQWCMNELEVAMKRLWSPASAGGQSSWGQEAPGTNLSRQAQTPPS